MVFQLQFKVKGGISFEFNTEHFKLVCLTFQNKNFPEKIGNKWHRNSIVELYFNYIVQDTHQNTDNFWIVLTLIPTKIHVGQYFFRMAPQGLMFIHSEADILQLWIIKTEPAAVLT